MELLYIAQQLKMPIVEVAVNWQEIEGKVAGRFERKDTDPLDCHHHYLFLSS